MKFTIAILAAAQAIRLQANDEPADYMFAQLPEYGETEAYMLGWEGYHGEIKRNTPERFHAERDDRLMNSLINNYAREIKKDGEDSGHFFLAHDDAQAACAEVAKSHGQHDARADEDKERFEEVWNHFDVNHDGLVEVERMPQFLRMFLGNALDIDL